MDVQLSRKAKLTILIVLVISGFPLWALSEGGMTYFKNKFEAQPNDPKTPERLYRLAWIYDITWRPDKADEILVDWFFRYGGDESDYPAEEAAISWIKRWTDENPRPATYPKNPHPLTPSVLLLYAEHHERKKLYVQSRHIYEIIVRRHNTDAAVLKRAQDGILRDRARTF